MFKLQRHLILEKDDEYELVRTNLGGLILFLNGKRLKRFIEYQLHYRGSRRNKLAVNRKFFLYARTWLRRHRELRNTERWTVKCLSIDGRGTECPLHEDGKCRVTRWEITGCLISVPARRAAPGECDGPLDIEHSILPYEYDEHGFLLGDYRDILLEKGRHDLDNDT
jgi:hypothetical protein